MGGRHSDNSAHGRPSGAQHSTVTEHSPVPLEGPTDPVCCSVAEAMGTQQVWWRILSLGPHTPSGLHSYPLDVFGKDVGPFGPEPASGSVMTTSD